jgi:hypothetical protein
VDFATGRGKFGLLLVEENLACSFCGGGKENFMEMWKKG